MGNKVIHCNGYSLLHHDDFIYYEYFEFMGKKYPVGSFVKLTDEGDWFMARLRGRGFEICPYRLIDHYITNKGVEKWEYLIGRTCGGSAVVRSIQEPPEKLIDEVLSREYDESSVSLGETNSSNELPKKVPNIYYSPKDWEVEGVMLGWFLMALVFIGAFIFKPLIFRLAIQIGAGFYFGNWREKKINEAIEKQQFKNKPKE